MTEKEFRKLRAKDLVQLLLTQGGEASQLQEQIDKKGEELAALLKDNDCLKIKLDDSDAYIEDLKKDLDQRDIHIRSLETEMDTLRNDLWIDMPEIGILTEAIQILNDIFETAQREADQHIQHARELGINPNKVKVARPAMPVTAMPQSSASARAEVKAEPKLREQVQAEPEAASVVSEPTALEKESLMEDTIEASVASEPVALEKESSMEDTIAASVVSEPVKLEKENPMEDTIAASVASEPVELEKESRMEDTIAASAGPESTILKADEIKMDSAESFVAAESVQPEADEAKVNFMAASVASGSVVPELEEEKAKTDGAENMSAIDRFAAESKAAFESEERVSAIDRLSSHPADSSKEQPQLINKAIAAAAAAIEEGKPGNHMVQGAEVDQDLVIPALQPEDMMSEDMEPQPFAGQSPASSTHEKKQSKRKGLFGFMKSGKDKSRRDADRYESSPMVARMKN